MSAIGGVSQGAGYGPGFSSLSNEDFSKIIFAELSKQDPLAPNDTNTLLQQLANIRSIQSNMDLSANISRLVGESSLSTAAGLIGHTVSGLNDRFDRVEGRVVSVSRTEIGPVLTLDTGQIVPMALMDKIVETKPSSGGES